MNIQKILRSHEFILFVLIVVFFAIGGSISPAMLSAGNFLSLIRSSIPLSLFALGAFLVMLSGGIDASSTGIAILTLYLTTMLLNSAGFLNCTPIAILMSGIAGMLLGGFNAIFTAFYGMPALIVTLGTLNLFQGFLLTFVSKGVINTLPQAMIRLQGINLATAKTGRMVYQLPILVILPLVAYLVTWLILRFTQTGQGIYAIGGDIKSAKRMGFNPKKLKLLIYPYAGMLYGWAGLARGSLSLRVDPTYIVGKELIVIAAVILGGTRLTGGHGSILGIVLGVFLYETIVSNLVLLGIPSTLQEVIAGLLILGSIILSTYRRRIARNA